ncbi:MAG: TolC family protein [Polyangia bacterium]
MERALTHRVFRLPFGLSLSLSLALAAPAVAAPGSAPSEFVLPETLSLDDAVHLFRAHGYDLLIADSQVKSAEGDLASAAAVPNPTFTAGGSYTFEHTSTGFHSYGDINHGGRVDTPWGGYFTLGDGNALEDAISGKRGLRKRVAQAVLSASRLGRADAERQLEYQVKSQYIDALLARDQLDFAGEIQKGTTQTYELMHVRLLAGAVSEADEAKVETAKLEADQAVDEATEQLRVAKLGLAFLLGVRGSTPVFHVDQDLPAYRVPPGLGMTTSDTLIHDAIERRPDLRIVDKLRESDEAKLVLARRLRVPDLNLNMGYQQQAGTTASAAQPPTFTFGLGGTLPLLYAQRGEIMKAEAAVKQDQIQRAKLAAQITTDVETAWTHFQSTRVRLERMQGRLLDRAKRARDLIEIQYKKGAASLLELLDAQRTFIAINEEYYQDLANYWTAIFQLEQAVGMELR